ncbi:hypothetical protein [Nonomuraea africana]
MSDDAIPPAAPPRHQCCTCGGTGIDSYGDNCPHCEGHGYC